MDTALMIIIWLPLLLPIFYCLMDKKYDDERYVSKTSRYEDVPYSPLNSDPQENHDDKQPQLTCRDKLTIVWKDMLLWLFFFVGEFGKFFLMQAVVTTLVFPSSAIEPRDHYQYYILAVMLGDVVGTSYGLVMYCFKCNLPSHTRHTWIFTFLIMASVFFLIFASWFRFLSNVWIVISISFFVGANHGVLYNCTFASAANGSSTASHKGFSRAFLTAGMGLGILGASLVGFYVEPLLHQHCLQISSNHANCLTRVISTGTKVCSAG